MQPEYRQWRTGGKVPINVYDADRPVCQCHSAEDAARIVDAMNRLTALEADKQRLCEHVIAISTTAGNRSISEIDLRVKIIGVCHSALQPAAPQPTCALCGGTGIATHDFRDPADKTPFSCPKCNRQNPAAPQLSGEAGEPKL